MVGGEKIKSDYFFKWLFKHSEQEKVTRVELDKVMNKRTVKKMKSSVFISIF